MEVTSQNCLQCQSLLNDLNLANEKVKGLEESKKEIEKKLTNSWEEVKVLQEKLAQFTNFWEKCPQKTKTEVMDLLVKHLGNPESDLDINCLNTISGKIAYFYSGNEKIGRSEAVSSLIGKVIEITQKKFKEGRRIGQTYYSLKLDSNTILRAAKEDLTPEKWTQIEELAVLDQNLVFKYRKWIVHKDICDFYPVENEPVSQP